MKAGSLILLFIFLAASFAPLLTKQNPFEQDLATRLQKPSGVHWMGTDQNGTDVFAQVVYGSRLSLFVAVAVIGVSSFFGLMAGSFAGFYGNLADETLMRVVDILQAFPGFLLALAIISFMGSSIPHMILALCITGWAPFARLVRGEVLHLRNREFVGAARAMGCTRERILLRHIWPNLFSLLLVQISFSLAGVVISEAGLSFLGLGAPPNRPSWGALLGSGRKYLTEAPYLSLFPGLAIVLLVLGFNLVGDGLRRHHYRP